jgi:hypothetical protein
MEQSLNATTAHVSASSAKATWTKWCCERMKIQRLYLRYQIKRECPWMHISPKAKHAATTLHTYLTASLASVAARAFTRTPTLPPKVQTLLTVALLSKNAGINRLHQAGERAIMICPTYRIQQSSHFRLLIILDLRLRPYLFTRQTYLTTAE